MTFIALFFAAAFARVFVHEAWLLFKDREACSVGTMYVALTASACCLTFFALEALAK